MKLSPLFSTCQEIWGGPLRGWIGRQAMMASKPPGDHLQITDLTIQGLTIRPARQTVMRSSSFRYPDFLTHPTTMPTYDYECSACGHTLEIFQGINDPHVKKCPACGKSKLQRQFGTGAAIVFKGSGFYQTDYRSDSYKKAAKADSQKSESGKSEGGKSESGKTEVKKTESKPSGSKPSSTKPKASD
jgi:putative FmdB family regulatory protein